MSTTAIGMPSGREILIDTDDLKLIDGCLEIGSRGYVHVITHRPGLGPRWRRRIRRSLHRLIMRPGGHQEVDHINGNKLDERRCNLRLGGSAMNKHNTRKTTKPTTSPFKGVSAQPGTTRWRAQICHNRRRMHLGYFDDETSAAKAYDEAAMQLFGEHACTNASGALR